MLGDPLGRAEGWEPVERISALVLRRSALRIVHATRHVGLGEHDATVVTIACWPPSAGACEALVVVDAPAIASAFRLEAGSYVLDPRLRWWSEAGRRHVDGPSLGVQISATTGQARGWPAIGSPTVRRRMWPRRVRIDRLVVPFARSGQMGSREPVADEASPIWQVLGTHPGLLSEWPIVAGVAPTRRTTRVRHPKLVGPDAVCREAFGDRGGEIDLRHPRSSSSVRGPRFP